MTPHVVEQEPTVTQIIDALRTYATVTKYKNGILVQRLIQRKLVVTVGPYAVVSEKGLSYMVDFNLIQ